LTGDVDIDDSTTVGDRPVMIMREIRPPLRRWAAAHLVWRDPAVWTSVLQRCGDLDARSAAAVMRGLLDAIDSLSEPAQSLLCSRAANWPQRDVRAAAEVLQLQRDKSGREPQPTRCTPANYKTKPFAHHHGEAAQQERLFRPSTGNQGHIA
jgi:hypothetical protein